MDLDDLLLSLSPRIIEGVWAFVSLSKEQEKRLFPAIAEFALMTYKEEEGLTVLVPTSKALSLGLTYEGEFRGITLDVHSNLAAVGLTAAVASRLASHQISANVIAATYHDHVFVAAKDAEKAYAVLMSISEEAKAKAKDKDKDKEARRQTINLWLVVSLIVLVLTLGGSFSLYSPQINRLLCVNYLFEKSVIVQNFRSIHELGFPYTTISLTRGAPVAELRANPATFFHKPLPLPLTFVWNGTTMDLNKWMKDHWTTGLVVIKKDSTTKARILHEAYNLGNDKDSKCVSWSMCKSVISALFGIAIDKGIIGDIDDKTVTDYVPELLNTGYEGVSLKNVLQMSSGVAFDENYFDPLSDINIMGYTLALGWSIDDYVSTLKRNHEPGSRNHYVSMDTQVLAMVLSRAANRSLAELADEFLWSKVGFESNATWVLDNDVNRHHIAHLITHPIIGWS